MQGEHGRADGRENALPGDWAHEDNSLPGRLVGRAPEDNVLPGTPMVIDMLSRHSLLPDVSRAGTRDVRMSDGNYVYMMTSQQHAVQLHEAVAVWPGDRHTTALPGGASRRGHGEQQEGEEVLNGNNDGEAVATDAQGTAVMIELKRKMWVAEESDIERERGEELDEVAACPICLEPLYSGKALVTSCSHCFHVECCRISERVAIGSTGFWSCPSCRETITTIRARTVKDGEASAELDTTPNSENSVNLTYILRRNPAMQSIIRRLLLLEDYVVGARDNATASDLPVQGLTPASPTSVPSQTQAVGMHQSSHANTNSTDNLARERSATAGAAEEGKITGVDGDKDLEAGSSNIPDVRDGAGSEKVSVFVVPLGGGQGENERLKHWPSASKPKGEPGLLTVMVKMEHLLLHDMVGGDGIRGMMSLGGDEGVSGERLLAENELSFWRKPRCFMLGCLAVCLEVCLEISS